MKTYNIEINKKYIVTSEDIDDIMCAALEGGINYWCRKAEVVGEYLGDYASEWRKKCREKTTEKNSPTALGNLPVGTKIKFLAPFDMKFHNKGDEIVVWKAKKGYKNTTYWIDGHFAYPAKVIGTEYEIIEEE